MVACGLGVAVNLTSMGKNHVVATVDQIPIQYVCSVQGVLGGSRDYGQEVSERERRIMLVQPRMDLERNACGCSNSVLH